MILAHRAEVLEKSEQFKQLIFEEICKTEPSIYQKFVETMEDFGRETDAY